MKHEGLPEFLYDALCRRSPKGWQLCFFNRDDELVLITHFVEKYPQAMQQLDNLHQGLTGEDAFNGMRES